MARREKFDYFEAFVEIADRGVEYATELAAWLEHAYEIQQSGGTVDPVKARERFGELHKIESAADRVCHDISTALVSEFIPPIEREDILELASELDDVVDDLDDILQFIYMYNVHEIRKDTLDMMEVVVKSTKAVQAATQKFTHFKKSASLRDRIVEINDYEEEGDRVYLESMHAINSNIEDFHTAYGWSCVLGRMEKCCDACENVGHTMVMVLMKNS